MCFLDKSTKLLSKTRKQGKIIQVNQKVHFNDKSHNRPTINAGFWCHISTSDVLYIHPPRQLLHFYFLSCYTKGKLLSALALDINHEVSNCLIELQFWNEPLHKKKQIGMLVNIYEWSVIHYWLILCVPLSNYTTLTFSGCICGFIRKYKSGQGCNSG